MILRPALERFAEKCRFDPATGCVLWTGALSAGVGNTTHYGRFWYEKRMWLAHRWSGVFIHKLDLDGLQAGHCCPHGHNSLCVQHIEPITFQANTAEQHARLGNPGQRETQTSRDRQYFLFIQLGIEPARERAAPSPDLVPFYDPPEWFRPFMPVTENSDDCPF